jgi:hypothetical protein
MLDAGLGTPMIITRMTGLTGITSMQFPFHTKLDDHRDAGTALRSGEKWLGAGYREIAPGVFRSADGLRQFRMTTADLLPRHGNIGSHVHFEALDQAGKVIENLHLPVTP